MADEKLGPPPPVVLAMLICDAIHQDPATKKCTLLGTFSTISARKFPVVHRMMAVHIALTEGRGQVRIKLTLVGEREDLPPIFSGEGMIGFNDPRAVAELNFQLANVAFQEPGDYRIQVWGNDQLLMQRRLRVMQAPNSDDSQTPPPPPPDQPFA